MATASERDNGRTSTGDIEVIQVWWFFLGAWATAGFFFQYQARQDFSQIEKDFTAVWFMGGFLVFALARLLMSKLRKEKA